MTEENAWKLFIRFITNRCLVLFILILLSFYLLLSRLFYLQIVKGSDYQKDQTATQKIVINVPASRGNIYDRFGRPLAVNQTAYTVEMNASIVKPDAEILYDLIRLMENNGETIVDTFPITKDEPLRFDTRGKGISETQWKKDMELKPEETARACFDSLRKKFKIDPALPDSEARKILNLCSMLYLQRFQVWSTITIAYNVKVKTIAIIEEDTDKFGGFTANVIPLRFYPEGQYFSHIIGYTGKINQDELESNPDYKMTDLIGKTGLEKSFENALRGVGGSYQMEIDASNQVVTRLPGEISARQGDSVYLTIDRDLQKKCFDILQVSLKQSLINQLQGKGDPRFPISVKHLLSSMTEGSVLDIRSIMESPSEGEGSASAAIKDYVLSVNAEAKWIDEDPETEKKLRTEIKSIISAGIQAGTIAPAQMLLILLEQGIITGDEKYAADIASSRLRPITVLINKLESGEITPQMTDLDPSSGSIVVLDVKNGDVLAAVGYPSYDNNEMVNNLNYNYFVKQNDDPTHPLQNRPFQERRAPGSTFKMITAIAALENGSITPGTQIYDKHTFTAAGEPFLNCWSAVSHGSINISQALSVSCNYFFCEAAYRLGNSKSNNKLQSIESLNQYMTYFGLNAETGVEIGESSPEMSSPALKDEKKLIANPDAPLYERDWYDGDTVQTAIGQSLNGYTAANMAKYIMTLANRGVRYETHLVDSVRSMDGALVNQTVPVIEMSDMPIGNSTWEAVYQGMLLVTEGANGTGRNVFSAFPVRVAGKTGTAQQIVSRNDHSAFGGFAPYEDPQIAVYVNIPFGDTRAMPALAGQIARMVMEEYFQLNSEPQRPETVNTLAI